MPQASPMNWVLISTLVTTSIISFTMLLESPSQNSTDNKFFSNNVTTWIW